MVLFLPLFHENEEYAPINHNISGKSHNEEDRIGQDRKAVENVAKSHVNTVSGSTILSQVRT